MAAPPILLVADDLSVIASVKRVLAREGYECVLATSAADAVIAWGHLLPGLILLEPGVESDRGGVLLEELQIHPDAALLRVVLLGETIPGFSWPVVPLPLDPVFFAQVLEENIRTSDGASASWSVLETAPASSPPPLAESPHEVDDWRATSPHEVDRAEAEAGEDMPEPQAIVAEPTPPQPPPAALVHEELEEKLFGDLAADVEAEAMQSVESSLQQRNDDEELNRLEDDVRAEAQRRRQSREARAVTVKPAPAATPPEDHSPPLAPGEDSFEGMGETPAAPPSRANEVLARAEQMVLESRAQSEAHQRAEEADARALRDEASQATRRADHAQELVRAERDARSAAEEQLYVLRDEVTKLNEDFATERELTRVRHENELEALKSEAESAREKLEGQHTFEARKRAEAERSFEAAKKKLAALETELDSASGQLSSAREQGEKLESVESELEVANTRIATLESELAAASGQLSSAREQAEKLESVESELEAANTRIAALESALATASGQLSTAREEAEKLGSVESELEAANTKIVALDAQVAELEVIAAVATEEQTKRRALEDVIAERDLQLERLNLDLRGAREDADAALALANEVEAERQRLEETRSQLVLTERHLAEARTARDEAQTEMLTIEEARDSLQGQLADAQVRMQALQADVTSSSELLEDTAKERDTLRTRIATLEPYQPLAERVAAELEAETRRRTGLEAQLEDASRSLDNTRTRAETLEATAVLASEKVKALEAREVMSLALPGKHTLGLARHGSVGLEGLARVVSQLVLGNAEVRLELGTTGGTRMLWFKRGQIIAAESSLDHEGVIARARRDGLIDTKQDSELRMLKGATPREQLDALKARGFIRDIESVPLVQRYTEQVALDSFTEEQTLYRIVEEAPKPEVLLATVPRPTLPMLAESLRRAVAPDVMLEKLGGGEAVAVATDSELDLRALGFSERERKMLTWVDGEATIEDLSLASGLKPDLAFRALLVAQLLGIIEVRPGVKRTEPNSGQLDLQRLEAKFDEVQDADYFTILGLSRAAGTEDVRRAFQRLAQEFDPLRFSGHTDPAVQQHAQVVAKLLEEAARALEDDRRRVEYARHLLD